MEELEDAMVQAAARGDRQAFRRFYEFYAPTVWRVSLRTLGGDEALARQVTQDVFVRAHGSLKRFNRRSSLSTWLYRIAWNRCMSAAASRRRWWSRMRPLGDAAAASEEPRFEARDAARRILGSLSPQDRFLLVAREMEGVPFEELAATTGIGAGALRTRVSRIKQGIRERSPQ